LTRLDAHVLERPDDTEALSVVGSLTIIRHIVDGLVIFKLEKCHWRKFTVAAACVVAAGGHFGRRVEAMSGHRQVKFQDPIVTGIITTLRTNNAQLFISPKSDEYYSFSRRCKPASQ